MFGPGVRGKEGVVMVCAAFARSGPQSVHVVDLFFFTVLLLDNSNPSALRGKCFVLCQALLSILLYIPSSRGSVYL